MHHRQLTSVPRTTVFFTRYESLDITLGLWTSTLIRPIYLGSLSGQPRQYQTKGALNLVPGLIYSKL